MFIFFIIISINCPQSVENPPLGFPNLSSLKSLTIPCDHERLYLAIQNEEASHLCNMLFPGGMALVRIPLCTDLPWCFCSTSYHVVVEPTFDVTYFTQMFLEIINVS